MVSWNMRLVLRALLVSCSLVVLISAASLNDTRLNVEDVPQLPAPNGSNDTPEMIVSMIRNGPASPSQPSKIKLSSLHGGVVILDMFYSQCHHCRDHAPHMVDLYKEFQPKGLSVMGLATDRPESVADVRAFMRDLKISYPVGFITTEMISYFADSHNRGVPQIILFGRDGKMLKRWIGWSDTIGKEVHAAVQGTLGGSAPAAAPAMRPQAKPAKPRTR